MMNIQQNKKVKNATPTEVDGISFRSALEAKAYERTKEVLGGRSYLIIDPKPSRIEIMRAYSFLGENISAMHYTPDLVLDIWKWPCGQPKIRLIIELKGNETDAYKVRRKLIMKNVPRNALFFEIHTLQELTALLWSIDETLKTDDNEIEDYRIFASYIACKLAEYAERYSLKPKKRKRSLSWIEKCMHGKIKPEDVL